MEIIPGIGDMGGGGGHSWNNSVSRNRILEEVNQSETSLATVSWGELRKIARRAIGEDVRSHIKEKSRTSTFQTRYRITEKGLQIADGGSLDGRMFHEVFVERVRSLGPSLGVAPDEAELARLEKLEQAILAGSKHLVTAAGKDGAFRYLQDWQVKSDGIVVMRSFDIAAAAGRDLSRKEISDVLRKNTGSDKYHAADSEGLLLVKTQGAYLNTEGGFLDRSRDYVRQKKIVDVNFTNRLIYQGSDKIPAIRDLRLVKSAESKPRKEIKLRLPVAEKALFSPSKPNLWQTLVVAGSAWMTEKIKRTRQQKQLEARFSQPTNLSWREKLQVKIKQVFLIQPASIKRTEPAVAKSTIGSKTETKRRAYIKQLVEIFTQKKTQVRQIFTWVKMQPKELSKRIPAKIETIVQPLKSTISRGREKIAGFLHISREKLQALFTYFLHRTEIVRIKVATKPESMLKRQETKTNFLKQFQIKLAYLYKKFTDKNQGINFRKELRKKVRPEREVRPNWQLSWLKQQGSSRESESRFVGRFRKGLIQIWQRLTSNWQEFFWGQARSESQTRLGEFKLQIEPMRKTKIASLDWWIFWWLYLRLHRKFQFERPNRIVTGQTPIRPKRKSRLIWQRSLSAPCGSVILA